MSYKVIMELRLKNGKVQDFFDWCKPFCETIRNADGCVKIEIGITQNNQNNCFIIQEWNNFQNYEDYFFEFEKTGLWRSLAGHILNDPKITFCHFSEM